MKVVVAVDSFKGSVSAPEACRAIADGIVEACEGVDVLVRPMADGGEGTAEVMRSAMRGEWTACRVAGPMPGQRVDAGYAWFPSTRMALVEMAAASGLVLVDAAALDPMTATTFGTGELLAAAAEHGAERILLAVGGSATVDGGAGAAEALGWTFLGEDHRGLGRGGGALREVHSIRFTRGPALPRIDVLCDVRNPLLGDQGAARIYGPQKGATAETLPLLEAGLEQFARCVLDATGRDIREIPGGGAAGGLAAGAYGLLGARLVSGADAVLEAVGLPDALENADWVISGEGTFDGQSTQGKVVSAVVRAGHAAGAKTAVVAGRIDRMTSDPHGLGIDALLQSSPPGMPTHQAMREGASLLRAAGKTFAEEYLARGCLDR